MYPNREKAITELNLAGELNPGPWTKHSHNVANAAELIAKSCGMDIEKCIYY